MKKMDVVFLLDRSGSMYDSVCDTIGGFNSYLDGLRDKKGIKVTTVLFDNEYEVLYEQKSINSVENLTTKDYYVRGSTALYDAIGLTISNLESKIKNSKVLFIITTDGYENSSKEYNKEKIKSMIEKHSDWEFIYMGANIDSYKEGTNIGIRCDNIANYEKKKGTKKMFEALKCASDMVYEERLSSDWKSNLQ